MTGEQWIWAAKTSYKQNLKDQKEEIEIFQAFDRGTQAACLHRCGHALCMQPKCVQVRTVLNAEGAYCSQNQEK